MIVNLDVMSKVQLNDLGKRIWLAQIEALPEEIKKEHPEVTERLSSMIDDNNCLEIELGSLMAVFGPYISSQQIPFVTKTIQLSHNPNFGKIQVE